MIYLRINDWQLKTARLWKQGEDWLDRSRDAAVHTQGRNTLALDKRRQGPLQHKVRANRWIQSGQGWQSHWHRWADMKGESFFQNKIGSTRQTQTTLTAVGHVEMFTAVNVFPTYSFWMACEGNKKPVLFYTVHCNIFQFVEISQWKILCGKYCRWRIRRPDAELKTNRRHPSSHMWIYRVTCATPCQIRIGIQMSWHLIATCRSLT